MKNILRFVAVWAAATFLFGLGRAHAQPVVGGQDLALWVTSPTAIFLGGVIAAVVQAAKKIGFPDNLSPVLAVALGVVGGLLYVLFYGSGLGWRPEVGDVLLRGLVLGLISGGVFTFTTAIARTVSGQENIHGQAIVERRRT